MPGLSFFVAILLDLFRAGFPGTQVAQTVLARSKAPLGLLARAELALLSTGNPRSGLTLVD